MSFFSISSQQIGQYRSESDAIVSGDVSKKFEEGKDRPFVRGELSTPIRADIRRSQASTSHAKERMSNRREKKLPKKETFLILVLEIHFFVHKTDSTSIQ